MGLSVSAIGGYDTLFPVYSTTPVSPVDRTERLDRNTQSLTGTKENKRVEKGECQTCKNRKYVDGSNDLGVSFKTPGHISPESSAGKVMAHEQEHVSRAVAEGNQPNKELLSATVTLHTSTCPECGRVYVSGGTTHTTMKTTRASNNPYDKLQQQMKRNLSAGLNFDMTA